METSSKLPTEHLGPKSRHTRLGSWAHHLSIGQKISVGYTIAIGVAALGILSGQFLGDLLLEQPATNRKVLLQREAGILVELKDAILEAQSDVTPFLRNPDLLPTYYYHLLNRADQVQKLFARFEQAVEETKTLRLAMHHHDELFQEMGQIHQDTVETYWEELATILEPLRSSSLSQTMTRSEAQSLLIDFINSPAALKLETLVTDLDSLIEEIQDAEDKANLVVKQAKQVSRYVTLASLVISIIVAIAISAYLKRQITQPLMDVVNVAQQVTAESNFELQAPVTTQDEVGILGDSLNHLIIRVKTLLAEQAIAQEELASYSHTLEQRVADRTEELHEKNSALNNALQKLQKTQLHIVQSEKMSSLGQLVAGVAHEINNPVSFIHGNLAPATDYTLNLLSLVQTYQQEYPHPTSVVQAEIETIDLDFLQDDLPKLLKSMKIGTQRIQSIVKSLRTFSRLDEADLKNSNIHDGLDSTLMILQSRIKPNPDRPAIKILKDYGDLPLVECYPGQLNQVFMNLITNAIDALEETDGNHPPTDKEPCIHIQTQHLDSNHISISIKDNGPGIPEAIQSQLFDPFFTTKPVGKGTGLGLAISHQVVERHHGTLHCHSVVGQGTDFVMILPIKQCQPLR